MREYMPSIEWWWRSSASGSRTPHTTTHGTLHMVQEAALSQWKQQRSGSSQKSPAHCCTQ